MAESDEVQGLRDQIASLQLKLDAASSSSPAVGAPYSASYDRSIIKKVLGAPDGGMSLIGSTLRFGGWVKTGRTSGGGAFAFLELNDGSCAENMQIMVDAALGEKWGGLKPVCGTGTCVLVEGELVATPEGKKQNVELKASELLHVGLCGGSTYPLSGKKITLEFLRDKAHLRPRTNIISAVARIRNALAFATHRFFQENGFLYVHTPLITCSDAEGAGEMFQVTTLFNDMAAADAKGMSPEDLKTLQEEASAQGGRVAEAKTAAAADKSDAHLKAAVQAEVSKLKQLRGAVTAAEAHRDSYHRGLPFQPDGAVDFSKDFFGKRAFLTVSGQINGEYYACGLSNVYTFGPTFRAENSNTTRHLAEFWMIEPEMAFCRLEDDMRCAEDYVQHCCAHVLEHCAADLAFMEKTVDKECVARLKQVVAGKFARCSYTEAIDILKEAVSSGKKTFQKQEHNEVAWGDDLGSEQERYLCEEVYGGPVIVYNYPAHIKAFYMKLNEDGKTVAAMDMLVPGVGELIGGSQREDDLELLKKRTLEAGMDLEAYEGYYDLRQYGNVPHSGFGLGFERLIMFATGIENIRDVIPFPRWPGNAKH